MNPAATSVASHSQQARSHASRAERTQIANAAAQAGATDFADAPEFSAILQGGQTAAAKAANAAESAATSASPKRNLASDLNETAQTQVAQAQTPQTQVSQAQLSQAQLSQAQLSQAQLSQAQATPDPANSGQLNPQVTPSAPGFAGSGGLQTTASTFTAANDVAQGQADLDPAAAGAKVATALSPQSPVSPPALTGLPIETDADGEVTPEVIAAGKAAAGQLPTSPSASASPASTASASSSTKSLKSSESTASYLASLSGQKADIEAGHTELSSAVAAVPTGDQGGRDETSGGPANQEGGTSPDGSAAASSGAPDVATQNPDPGALLFQPQMTQQATTPAPSATATPQTVNALAAQIVQKLDGAATRFQLTLNPEGLGKVDVAIEITAKGSVSATLSFQHAESTAALSSHADALRQALADAGLNLNPEDLSFQTASGGADANGGQFDQASQGQTGNPHAGLAAMSRASDAVETAPATAWTASRSAGLNLLI